MEHVKLSLRAKLEDTFGLLEDKLWDLKSGNYSTDLEDIIEEAVDELENDFELEEKVNDLVEKIACAETIEELEEIEGEIDLLECDIDDLALDDENIIDKINEHFVYYDDAWEYLQCSDITDFEEAFDNGITDITGIATYYLEQEYYNGGF